MGGSAQDKSGELGMTVAIHMAQNSCSVVDLWSAFLFSSIHPSHLTNPTKKHLLKLGPHQVVQGLSLHKAMHCVWGNLHACRLLWLRRRAHGQTLVLGHCTLHRTGHCRKALHPAIVALVSSSLSFCSNHPTFAKLPSVKAARAAASETSM